MTRDVGSAPSGDRTSGTMTKSATPTLTRICVRSPAGLLRSSRSNPTAPPPRAAMRIRKPSSGQSSAFSPCIVATWPRAYAARARETSQVLSITHRGPPGWWPEDGPLRRKSGWRGHAECLRPRTMGNCETIVTDLVKLGTDPVQSASLAGLSYVADMPFCIRRVRAGKGFRYVDSNGKTITDANEVRRIRALAIPPAWTDVRICPRGDGHIQ